LKSDKGTGPNGTVVIVNTNLQTLKRSYRRTDGIGALNVHDWRGSETPANPNCVEFDQVDSNEVAALLNHCDF